MPNESMMRVFKVDNGTKIDVYQIRDSHINVGYGNCSTPAETIVKAVTMTDTNGWLLRTGSVVVVEFENDVPENAKLNVVSTGVKNIYFHNVPIDGESIKAGDTVSFIYDGIQYNVLSIDRKNEEMKIWQGGFY